MKKKRLQDSQVSISSATLKALKGLLFTDKGFDCTPLIQDLAVTRNEDLVALNIGLVLKGLTPEIAEDDKIRFHLNERASNNSWQKTISYYKFEFVGYSLIDDTVSFKRTIFKAEKNKDLSAEQGTPIYRDFDNGTEAGFDTCSLDYWLYDYECDNADILATIRDYKN